MTEICLMKLDPDTRAVLVKHLLNSMIELSGKLMGGEYTEDNLVAFDELSQLVRGVVMVKAESVETKEETQDNE